MAQDDTNEGGTRRAQLPPELDRERAIDTHQAADLTGLAPITLAQWRARGEGPPFFRVGARQIRYRLGDVLDWRDARTVGRKAVR